jgi:hypothetical protein
MVIHSYATVYRRAYQSIKYATALLAQMCGYVHRLECGDTQRGGEQVEHNYEPLAKKEAGV